MKILLDTHIAIWALYDSSKLPSDISKYLLDYDNDIYYSLVSAWEIEIKHNVGKLEISAEEFMSNADSAGMNFLPITKKHIARLSSLPIKDDHRDPFDRMLISQSIVEKMLLLTVDEKVRQYLN